MKFYELGRVLMAASFASCTLVSRIEANANPPAAPSVDPPTWTDVVQGFPRGLGNGPDVSLLLTDGTVMVHQVLTSNWFRLTPDESGSYILGTWTQLHPMPSNYEPEYFASAVLPDGRLIVEGGEYNAADPVEQQDRTTLGAIYNPVTDSWTNVNPPSGWQEIGDAPGVVLPDGTFMIGSAPGVEVAKLNASNLTWTISSTNKQDTFGEEGFTLLPSGNLLVVDANAQSRSEVYTVSTNTWAPATIMPVNLSDGSPCFEVGPHILRPDGSVFAVGANSNTAILSAAGAWSIGPSIPGGLASVDGVASVLPNGNVLFTTAAATQTQCYSIGTTQFFEFDGININPAPAPNNTSKSVTGGGFMLVLPTGQIFYTDSIQDSQPHVYTPIGTYQASWQPSVTTTFTASLVRSSFDNSIQGQQFNGMTQGAALGDDGQMATNYPLVRIVNTQSQRVVYARTHSFSTMAVATGSTPVSAQFDLPAKIQSGPSTLFVVANGIPSAGTAVNIACSADGIYCDGFDF